jgi:hypothetical protein
MIVEDCKAKEKWRNNSRTYLTSSSTAFRAYKFFYRFVRSSFPFHHCTTTIAVNTCTITATMSATLYENMSDQDDEDQPKTIESYAALVKQLVPDINMVLRDLHWHKQREDLAARDEELKKTKDKLKENDEFFEIRLQQRLAEKEQEWNERMDTKFSELKQERNDIAFGAIQNMRGLHRSNIHWSQAMTAVLASTTSGEDIPSNLFHLFLSKPFTSIDNFRPEPVSATVFAETYTGLGSNVSEIIKNDLLMAELLCWIKDVAFPSAIPANALDRVVWLETHLLEDIRVHKKRHGWVLLAFSVLSKMVNSNI